MGDCFGQKPPGGSPLANQGRHPQTTAHRSDATCADAVRGSICLCHGFTTRDRSRKAERDPPGDRNMDRSHRRPRSQRGERDRLTRARGAYLPHPLCLTLGTCGQAACTPREHGQAHRPARGQAHRPARGQAHRPARGQGHRPNPAPRPVPALHVLRLAGSPYSPASPCLSAIWLMSYGVV